MVRDCPPPRARWDLPRIGRVDGAVVWVYYGDHPPPHFHASAGGDEVVMEIETGRTIAGGLPPAVTRRVRAWAERNRAELLANWERAVRGQPLRRVGDRSGGTIEP
jgi:hypothetical protein